MREIINSYLKNYLGNNAEFRDGQEEAINTVLNRENVLLVQKTGWGKSLVYFLVLKYLKIDKPNGIGVIITPLLSLIRDQINKAREFDIIADTITSSSSEDEINKVNKMIIDKKIDLLFVSPERFANQRFMNETFPNLEVLLFIIDEAHCISDWGHDFRPDYMRLVSIFSNLPKNTPLVLTTATANDRVVDDIYNQFGKNLKIIRGPLTRESLSIQVIELAGQAERLAWLKDHLNDFVGSGIIYTSTVRDAKKVSNWLIQNGYNVLSYYGQLESKDRIDRENKLLKNEVKALVATVALGMGFDKGDLAFVVHFQTPGSLVSYYQEIGRAGRSIDNAKIVMLVGKEDEEIQKSFINNKMSENDIKNVWEYILNHSGSKLYRILRGVNLGKKLVNTIIKTLEVRDLIYKDENSNYFVTAKKFEYDQNKDKKFKQVQIEELEEIKSFVETKDCYMQFIASKLSDYTAKPCGKCSNCTGENIVSIDINKTSYEQAIMYLNNRKLIIPPRKQLPPGYKFNDKNKLDNSIINEEGRVLSIYGDTGIGELVKIQKYNDHYFSDDLVRIAVEYIEDKWKDAFDNVKWVTCIPSFKYINLVESLSERIAQKLNLPFHKVITKKVINRLEQKTMLNDQNQYENAVNSLGIDFLQGSIEPVLLIDDIVDSRMTFTVAGLLLKSKRVSAVYPFALASSSIGGDINDE